MRAGFSHFSRHHGCSTLHLELNTTFQLLLALILTFSITPAVAEQVHVVSVGRNETSLALRFYPETTIASIGDRVQFQFYPLNHSVIQSLPSTPCRPMPAPNGFFSGFMPISQNDDVIPSFTILIRDLNPIFFFCNQGRHCESGFVGAINPRPGFGVEEYRAAAMGGRLGRGNGGGGGGGGGGGQGLPGAGGGGGMNAASPTVPGFQVPTRGAGRDANTQERVVNVGAIVGGILGGVAILVLAVVGFGAWLIRKKGGFGLGMSTKERDKRRKMDEEREAKGKPRGMVDLRIVTERERAGASF